MTRYKHCYYNQESMVVINFEEHIQPGTFEYALHHLISDRLYLTPFDELYTDYCKAINHNDSLHCRVTCP